MPVLTLSVGANLNANALAQSDSKWAVGTIKSGEGLLKAGTLLSLDPSDKSRFVKLNPDATDGTEKVKGILLETVDATLDDKNAKIGYFGTYTYKYTMISTSQEFTGDGTTTTFYLSKLPKQGTVRVKVNGNFVTEGQEFTVNYETGAITFDTAPASGSSIIVYYGYEPTNAVIEDAMDKSIWIIDIIG